MRVILASLVVIFLNGCAGASLDRGFPRSSLTDNDLLLEILHGFLIPTAFYVYSDSNRVARIDTIELEDVVNQNTSCIIADLRSNASRMDLEVINSLWVKSDGRAKAKVVDSVGWQVYYSGVEAYSNASFDCTLVVSRWLDEMDS